MKNTISFIIGLVMVAFMSGCVALGNGNIAKNTGPLPYKTEEKAVVTKEVTHIDVNGKVTKDVTTTTKTGLAVNEGIQHHKLDVANNVGVAQAGGSGRTGGFVSWLFTPTPGYQNTSGSSSYYPNVNTTTGGGFVTPYGFSGGGSAGVNTTGGAFVTPYGGGNSSAGVNTTGAFVTPYGYGGR